MARSHNKITETVIFCCAVAAATKAATLPGYEICNARRMANVAAAIDPPSSRSAPQICKRFDIRAEHALQLELRLDAFSRALDLRGGRVLDVSRSQKPEGGHLASVQYSLPLSFSALH